MALHRLFATLFLALALAAPALAADWGKDYVEISPPQPVDTRGKVEVIEFFYYGCPHCARLEPELKAWARKLPGHVVLKRQPVAFNDSWLPLTRAYYALEAVGLLNKLHEPAFRALHDERINLADPKTFFDWAASKGADRAKLAAAYSSFSVETQAKRAQQIHGRYKIEGVPAFVVNGKYQTSASLTGSNKKLFETLDELIKQEHGARR